MKNSRNSRNFRISIKNLFTNKGKCVIIASPVNLRLILKEMILMKKIICLAAASMLAVTAFVSCGKDKDSDKSSGGSGLEGKWACCEMTADGQTLTSLNVLVVNIPLEAVAQLTANSDGTFEIGSGIVGMNDAAGEDESQKGTWEKIDDTTFKLKSETVEADSLVPAEIEIKMDGDAFTFEGEEDGKAVSLKFKRVTEFTTYDVTSALGGLADSFGALGGNDDDDDE